MATGCVEWKVAVSDTMTPCEPDPFSLIWPICLPISGFFKRLWNMVVIDPRRAIHGVKAGFALSIVSLFYYVRPLYDGIGGTGIGAVMTVAVIFDFTVGGTISRAFNRVTATLFGGSLAIAIHYIADISGQKTDPVIRGSFVFLIALVVTFARLIPTVKRRYDYGMMTFILTFSLVSVSGYRVGELTELAQRRCLTIGLGSSICVIVSMFVNPIWAGSDLHLLCVKNMEKLAASLDGCVAEYFSQGGTFDGKEVGVQVLEGYKCVLNSKPLEDSLANLASWEPPHGQFLLEHPWQKYLTIGAAMRNCGCCIDALYSYMKSEVHTQAPEHLKKNLNFAFMRLSSQSSAVLNELANSIRCMRQSTDMDTLIKDMSLALGELQMVLKSLPNEKRKGQDTLFSISLDEIMPLIAIASQLIEISSRIIALVDAVNDLADDTFYNPSSKEKLSNVKGQI